MLKFYSFEVDLEHPITQSAGYEFIRNFRSCPPQGFHVEIENAENVGQMSMIGNPSTVLESDCHDFSPIDSLRTVFEQAVSEYLGREFNEVTLLENKLRRRWLHPKFQLCNKIRTTTEVYAITGRRIPAGTEAHIQCVLARRKDPIYSISGGVGSAAIVKEHEIEIIASVNGWKDSQRFGDVPFDENSRQFSSDLNVSATVEATLCVSYDRAAFDAGDIESDLGQLSTCFRKESRIQMSNSVKLLKVNHCHQLSSENYEMGELRCVNLAGEEILLNCIRVTEAISVNGFCYRGTTGLDIKRALQHNLFQREPSAVKVPLSLIKLFDANSSAYEGLQDDVVITADCVRYVIASNDFASIPKVPFVIGLCYRFMYNSLLRQNVCDVQYASAVEKRKNLHHPWLLWSKLMLNCYFADEIVFQLPPSDLNAVDSASGLSIVTFFYSDNADVTSFFVDDFALGRREQLQRLYVTRRLERAIWNCRSRFTKEVFDCGTTEKLSILHAAVLTRQADNVEFVLNNPFFVTEKRFFSFIDCSDVRIPQFAYAQKVENVIELALGAVVDCDLLLSFLQSDETKSVNLLSENFSYYLLFWMRHCFVDQLCFIKVLLDFSKTSSGKSVPLWPGFLHCIFIDFEECRAKVILPIVLNVEYLTREQFVDLDTYSRSIFHVLAWNTWTEGYKLELFAELSNHKYCTLELFQQYDVFGLSFLGHCFCDEFAHNEEFLNRVRAHLFFDASMMESFGARCDPQFFCEGKTKYDVWLQGDPVSCPLYFNAYPFYYLKRDRFRSPKASDRDDDSRFIWLVDDEKRDGKQPGTYRREKKGLLQLYNFY